MTNQHLTYLIYFVYTISTIIILAGFCVIFNTSYTIYRNQKRIRKESLHLLDIEYEEEDNKKLEPNLFEKSMFLVDNFLYEKYF